jgi:hypothetical protein
MAMGWSPCQVAAPRRKFPMKPSITRTHKVLVILTLNLALWLLILYGAKFICLQE